MTLRRIPILALCAVACLASHLHADEYRTENFIVKAPNKQLAETFGKNAERYRVEKAMEWLGKEMPRWPRLCPLVVEVTENRTGGATTFTFSSSSGVQSQEMKIFGPVKQLLDSVLPHEITHTVLAHHFGQAVPRWADEGGSVLSENDKERLDHDIKCREFLNAGRGIPLRILFPMKEYPRDMIVLYAQGYSASAYLIELGGGGLKGRQKFLAFLESGMKNNGRNWEAAIKQHYGFESVDDLQVKWIDSLRKPPVALASASRAKEPAGSPVAQARGNDSRGYETRTNVGNGLPQLEAPIAASVRAATPNPDDKSLLKPLPPPLKAGASRPTVAPEIVLGPPEVPGR
jgi:hypothetical protein